MLLSLAGCGIGPGDLPPVHQYMLTIKYPKQRSTPMTDNLIEILPAVTVREYSGQEFVYRTKGSQFMSDYYHTFFIPPSDMVTEMTLAYLKRAGIFEYASLANSLVKHFNFILKPVVEALYADYQNPARPKAVVAIRFILYNNDAHKQKVVFTKVYRQVIPLRVKTNQALVYAWNRGLQNIYRQFGRQLASIASKNP